MCKLILVPCMHHHGEVTFSLIAKYISMDVHGVSITSMSTHLAFTSELICELEGIQLRSSHP